MAKGISRICVCIVCLAAINTLHVLPAAAQEKTNSENKPGRSSASLAGTWTAEDRHLAMGSLYQPSQGVQKRQVTLHFKQVGDQLTGHIVTPKGTGASIEKEGTTGRTDFRTVTFTDDRLVLEYDLKELKHGWGSKLKNTGTIRIEAQLKDDRLVGKWGLFLPDGSEPFRGEWEAVRTGRVSKTEQKKEEPDALPGSATWDVKAFDEFSTVVKATYDPDMNDVHWTLEAKRNIRQINQYGDGYLAHFFDAEGVRLQEVQLQFTPTVEIKKGDKVRVTLRLPKDNVFSKTKKVVIVHKK